MLKKIFVCAVTFAMMLGLTGCGTEKVIGTPDKAVLAYAEIAMTGATDNMSAAGFTENDGNEIRYRVANTFVNAMKNITPLNQQTAEEVTKIYFDKLKDNVKFNVSLKKDDADRPIVQVTTTPIDQAETARTAAAGNDELLALIGMVGQLKADGATDDQLKENPDVQKLAVTALKKYIDNIRFRPEKTFDVPCVKVTGSDGKVHWAPLDSDAFINFLTGKD